MKVRISLIAITCAAVASVLGVGSARGAVVKSYCIDNATVTVSNDTLAGGLQQFQLNAFALFGGAYTARFSLGGGSGTADMSLLDALGDLSVITSPFQIPGGVFHPVVAGACATAAGTPDPGAAAAAAAAAGPAADAVAATPPAEEGIFLCYSKWQVDPGVWSADDAQVLLAGGDYWKPSAVAAGASSTTLGGHSLMCNPGKTTASVSAGAVDGSGNVVTDADLLGRLDVYPLG